MDYVQLLRSNNFNYVLVLVDNFSVFSIFLPARTTGAAETARLLYDSLFMVYGARTLLSDRGSCFRSKLVKSLCSLLNVKQIYTSSRHPQTNSRAESYNKNILNSLRTRCELEPNWPELLSTIGNSFKTSVAKNVEVSLYQVVFGRQSLSPIDHLLIPPQNLPISAKQYFENMKPQLKILRESVRQNQLQANKNTKKMHDAHGNVKIPKFAVGNQVWLREQQPSKVKLGHKTSQKFKGPYLIVEANSDFFTYNFKIVQITKSTQALFTLTDYACVTQNAMDFILKLLFSLTLKRTWMETRFLRRRQTALWKLAISRQM